MQSVQPNNRCDTERDRKFLRGLKTLAEKSGLFLVENWNDIRPFESTLFYIRALDSNRAERNYIFSVRSSFQQCVPKNVTPTPPFWQVEVKLCTFIERSGCNIFCPNKDAGELSTDYLRACYRPSSLGYWTRPVLNSLRRKNISVRESQSENGVTCKPTSMPYLRAISVDPFEEISFQRDIFGDSAQSLFLKFINPFTGVAKILPVTAPERSIQEIVDAGYLCLAASRNRHEASRIVRSIRRRVEGLENSVIHSGRDSQADTNVRLEILRQMLKLQLVLAGSRGD